MEWSGEEQAQLWQCWTTHEHKDDVERCRLLAMRAVELVASRGGTMTAGALEPFLAGFRNLRFSDIELKRIAQHIVAQGARIAVLEGSAEAMRYACLLAVHGALEVNGMLGSPLADALRSGIEGAAP